MQQYGQETLPVKAFQYIQRRRKQKVPSCLSLFASADGNTDNSL